MRRSARWGLFGVAMALGLGLIGSTWVGYRDADRLAPTLARGQAETYLRSFLERTRPEQGPPDPAVLEDLLDEHAPSGLRYIALVDPTGLALLEVGHALPGSDRPLPRPGEIRFDAGRVRMVAQPPPPPPPLRPPAGWSRLPPPRPREHGTTAPSSSGGGRPPTVAPPPGSAPPGPPLGPDSAPRILLEFEPLPATGLLAQAKLNLVVGIIAAAVLMAAAGVLGWLMTRADHAEEQLGRQRHLAALGEMSAVLAHEIRNPLAAVKGHVQLLAEQVDASHPQRQRIQTVLDEVLRLERLTAHLLDFARSDAVEREPTDPRELLEAAAARVDPARVELDVAEAPASWSLDPLRMGQVVENLLRNALQASPPEAVVAASVGQQRGTLVYTIADRGPGLDPAVKERIFEPFHTTRTRGTGLGLAIAQRIVQQHGGHIEATDHPAGGASFRICIPSS